MLYAVLFFTTFTSRAVVKPPIDGMGCKMESSAEHVPSKGSAGCGVQQTVSSLEAPVEIE